jgi:hypothetical protein
MDIAASCLRRSPIIERSPVLCKPFSICWGIINMWMNLITFGGLIIVPPSALAINMLACTDCDFRADGFTCFASSRRGKLLQYKEHRLQLNPHPNS